MLDELRITGEDYKEYWNFTLITEIYSFVRFRITIADVYRGTAYDYTCISKIKVLLKDF